MNQKTDIYAIWAELEKEAQTASTGICRRIVSNVSIYRAYVGINAFTGVRLIILEFPSEQTNLFDRVLDCKGISLDASKHGDELPGCNSCYIVASNKGVNDVFGAFAENVIEHIESISDQKRYTSLLIQRLLLWKIFFERTGGNGLSPKEQIGLLGELYILGLLIAQKGINAVDSWKGPNGASQDFQFACCGCEVKSTSNEYTKNITISNILQLDKGNLDKLYLCVLYWRTYKQQGQSLPETVAGIRYMIQGTQWELLFEELLLKEGFTDSDAEKYTTKYLLSKMLTFDIGNGFPVLTRINVPAGIENVSYDVNIAMCGDYIVDFNEAISGI